MFLYREIGGMMIGIKFLFRVLQFLVAAGLIALIIVIAWYILSRLFQWVWDSIEKSNGDFAVWMKGKFQRKSDAMPFLCRRGWHKWSNWSNNAADHPMYQIRVCQRCGYRDKKPW